MLKKAIIIYSIIQLIIFLICQQGGLLAQAYLAHITGMMTLGISITTMLLSFDVPDNKIKGLLFASGFLMSTGYIMFTFLRLITSKYPLTSIIFDFATTLSLTGNICLIQLLRKK